MSSERRLWEYVRDGLRPYRTHLQRHEDRVSFGIPDVSYGINGVDGWIELKYLPAWPAKVPTIVRFPKLTAEQRVWLRQRGERGGGHAWLLARIARDYLLVHHSKLDAVGHVPRGSLLLLTSGYWENRIDFDELAKILSTKRPNPGEEEAR